MMWKEPCIVFSPHWSFRLGPVVQLLHRWHTDNRCLLILEQGVDAEAALLPFKPMAIKVLQCSFLSGIKVDKIQPLLKLLQPKFVLFPEDMKSLYSGNNQNFSFLYYSENNTLHVPKFLGNFEVNLSTNLAFLLRPKRLNVKNRDIALARLEGGRLLLSNGSYSLVSSEEKSATELANKSAQKLYWGHLDPERLLSELQKKGFEFRKDATSASSDSDEIVHSIQINAQGHDALIKMSATQTVIFCANEVMAAEICEALSAICDGI